MASMASTAIANTSNSSIEIARAALVHQGATRRHTPSCFLGLPEMARKGRARCSVEAKRPSNELCRRMGAASVMAAWVTMASPAMGLVDERMTTEGTGLPLGLTNNLLGWILFGVFGLIWSAYFIYISTPR